MQGINARAERKPDRVDARANARAERKPHDEPITRAVHVAHHGSAMLGPSAM